MYRKGKGKCVETVYEKKDYFFKIIKDLRKDHSFDGLTLLIRDLSETVTYFFESTSHCFASKEHIIKCYYAKYHLDFIDTLKTISFEMSLAKDEVECFRFFIYKSLINYLMNANLIKEEIELSI